MGCETRRNAPYEESSTEKGSTYERESTCEEGSRCEESSRFEEGSRCAESSRFEESSGCEESSRFEESSMAPKKAKALLRFPPSHVSRPVTYHLVKDYDLKINILHAQISSSSVGTLVMDIEGSDDNLSRALSFLRSEGVEFRLLNGSVSWDDAACVHCGACTSVCPAGCLTMDKESWTLVFEKGKCLVCQACVKACPVGAMNIAI